MISTVKNYKLTKPKIMLLIVISVTTAFFAQVSPVSQLGHFLLTVLALYLTGVMISRLFFITLPTSLTKGGIFFFCTAVITGIIFIVKAFYTNRQQNEQKIRAVFGYSIVYLFIFFCGFNRSLFYF
ncbi:hypothetical protein JXQ31_12590 [candidate division KSB1 bacterium]|nr:hypothetical protein [candidate division KSB1 bacterium]